MMTESDRKALESLTNAWMATWLAMMTPSRESTARFRVALDRAEGDRIRAEIERKRRRV